MAIAGEDPWSMYAYATMFASIREQRRAAVSDEVRRLTGCWPVPVRETLASYKTA
jgi:NAD(P)H dehydrogenase (quinone)